MLASRYPTLPPVLVHKVIAFYLQNQVEVDRYLTACASAMDEQRRGSRRLDLNVPRQRLSASGFPPISLPPPISESQV